MQDDSEDERQRTMATARKMLMALMKKMVTKV